MLLVLRVRVLCGVCVLVFGVGIVILLLILLVVVGCGGGCCGGGEC